MKGLATSIGMASGLLLLSKCRPRAPVHSIHESSRGSWTGTWQELIVGLGGLLLAFVLLQIARRWAS